MADKLFSRSNCNKSFRKKQNLNWHAQHCKNNFVQEQQQQQGQGATRNNNEDVNSSYEEVEHAFNRTVIVLRKKLNHNEQFDKLQKMFIEGMPQKVEEELEKRLSIKWWPSLKLNFQKAVNNNVKTDPPIVFNSEPFTLVEKSLLLPQCRLAYNNIVQQIESFSQNGSGWVVDELINIDISIINIDPLK